jgi:cell filamentation protein
VPGYTIDGVPDDVLKNKLGVTTHDELRGLEAPLVAARYTQIEAGLGPSGNFDAEHLKAIHRHLFQDVYEWAGHTRDEVVRLSDGTFATEPFMHKGDTTFMAGPAIPSALDEVVRSLRQTDSLRGVSREEFADGAADVMVRINSVHAFREGNGRTQRVFMEQLARQAGHALEFSVVSQERMIEASVAASERGDHSVMRRLFHEISNPSRVEVLRTAEEQLDRQKYNWNERYIATVEPGYPVELTMVGIARDQFMAHTGSQILLGKTSDLPEPRPERGEAFTFVAPQHCWQREIERDQTRTQEAAFDLQSPDHERQGEQSEARMAKGKTTDSANGLEQDLDNDMDRGRQ